MSTQYLVIMTLEASIFKTIKKGEIRKYPFYSSLYFSNKVKTNSY